jgi:hypothetical protein
MTYVRTAAAAVLAGLLTLVVAAPASARSGPSWIQAPCATGAITDYAGAPDGWVSLAGWIQPCGEPTPDASFGILRYHEKAARLLYLDPSQMVQPYASATAPTSFTADYNVNLHGPIEDRLYGAIRAICVVRSLHAPVACVRIDLAADGGAPLVAPIPTDDPRMSVPVVLLPAEKKLDPACGNCV